MARDAAPSYIKSRQPAEKELTALRAKVAEVRDLKLEIQRGESHIKERKQELETMERKTLPELFNTVGIRNIGLDPTGNLPGYEATREPYIHASIAASWPEEKRQAAFDYLDKNGGGDLIKAEIVVSLPMKSVKERKEVIAALKKLKVPFTVTRAVPWGSLTAFIREMITRKKTMPPLELLGADVGEIVRLKPRKES